MGGRGGAGGAGDRGKSGRIPAGGSKDGTIIGGKPREIESYMREARGWSPAYHHDEILEAKTDGNGNLTFSYAKADSYEKTAKTNRTVNTKYIIQAGAINGETIGIDWSKVQSISGQTYNLRNVAKANGLSWDGKKKQWRRKK